MLLNSIDNFEYIITPHNLLNKSNLIAMYTGSTTDGVLETEHMLINKRDISR